MTILMTANVIVVIANALMLGMLLLTYGRMLNQMRNTLTMGLMAFAAILLLQCGVQLYFYATMMEYFSGGLEGLVLIQNLLATFASAFLLVVTLFPGLGGAKRRAAAPDEPA